MPRADVTAQFTKAMSKLLNQRKKHLAIIAKNSAKVAEIEGLFQQFGVSLELSKPAAKVGRPKGKVGRPAKKANGRRTRGVFTETAAEFVLGLLKGKSLTTKEINAAWAKTSRGGRADNTLMVLTKAKKVKRQKVKDGAGSQYSVARDEIARRGHAAGAQK
jgi:hypothetical protein